MGAKQGNMVGYVKKETVIIVAVIMLITGFFAGVMITVYKSSSWISSQISAPHQPQQAQVQKQQMIPQELAVKIFELEKKISESPFDFDQWVQLGNLYFDTGNDEKAIAAYNKYLEQHPDNADVLTDLGVVYRRSGQPVEAVSVFDRAIKSDPLHEAPRFNKGIVLMHDLNDLEGAIKEWEKLAVINPDAMSPGGKSVSELLKRFKQDE